MYRIQVFSGLPRASGSFLGPLHLFLFCLNELECILFLVTRTLTAEERVGSEDMGTGRQTKLLGKRRKVKKDGRVLGQRRVLLGKESTEQVYELRERTQRDGEL